VFLGVFLYAIGFIGGFVTPTQLDGAADRPLLQALAINQDLLALFAIQHSVMRGPRSSVGGRASSRRRRSAAREQLTEQLSRQERAFLKRPSVNKPRLHPHSGLPPRCRRAWVRIIQKPEPRRRFFSRPIEGLTGTSADASCPAPFRL
jgi:hypothetical protein